MRALLSTRLFAHRPLADAPLHLARAAGFPALELYADPRHFDPFALGEVTRVGRRLLAEGLQAPWLHLGPAVLNQLGDERKLATLADVVRGLRLEVVTADTHAWGVRQDGTFLGLDDLQNAMLENGARLVLDVGRVDDRIVRRLPHDLGLCWDMAAGSLAHEGDEAKQLDRMLEGMARGRLIGVRVAHQGDGIRQVPDTEEATLLEEVWRLQAPGTLVYDVDDPSGFGAEPELRDTLAALRGFHAGDKRRHPEGSGGLFWGALAPG